ncbi:unnamed protein product, partial [Staurois parvus]
MSEQYRYPPNNPFLQSRQSNVLHKKNGEFFEVVFFCHNFSENEKYFFLHTVT